MFGSSSTTSNRGMVILGKNPQHIVVRRSRRKSRRGASCHYAASGNLRVNSAPPPGRLAAVMSPLCASAIRLQMDSPSPRPVSLVVTNGAKIRAQVGRQSATTIGYAERQIASGAVVQVNFDQAPAAAGVQGVHQQIQQHLAELAGVQVGQDRLLSVRHDEFNAGAGNGRPAGDQGDGLFHQRARLPAFASRSAAAGRIPRRTEPTFPDG